MSAAMVDTNPDYSRQMYEPRSRPPDEPVKQPVYYRTGSPEVGLPLGRYADARKVLDRERHIEYVKFMKEKEESSNRRRDEMFRRREASPPRQNPAELYDHNQMSQQLREERRREYNDFLKESHGTPRAPPTPPVGLNIPTEQERLRIAELKKKQYRDELLRQQKEQVLNRASHQLEIPVIDRRQQYPAAPPLNLQEDRPPSGRWNPDSYRQQNYAPKRVTSPPHQANIGHDDYGSFQKKQEQIIRNREYNELLAKQRQKQEEKQIKMEEMRRQAPAPIVKGDYYNAEEYEKRREYLHRQKHSDYQNFLKSSERQHDRPPTPEYLQGLPLSQRQYDNMRKMQEKERNQEYNAMLSKLGFDKAHQESDDPLKFRSETQDKDKSSSPRSSQEGLSSLITGDRVDYPNSANRRFNQERRREYNEYLKKQEAEKYAHQENRNLENRIGFMANLGKPTNEMKEKLARERAEEYNRYLKNENWQKKDPSGEVRHPQEHGIGRDSRSDHTAPRQDEQRRDDRSYNNAPREADYRQDREDYRSSGAYNQRSEGDRYRPMPSPSYQEMLENKRRAEASYRRYDDPEYPRYDDRY